MTLTLALALFAAAFAAGTLNAVAGGGTLLTFPALVAAGLPPIVANATSSVSQWPGYVASSLTFRRELVGQRQFAGMSVASLAGGLLGAWLVTVVSPRLFDVLIPWLILLATAMFAFSATLTRWMGRHAANAHRSRGGLLAGQFVVSIYGGFFGGGMGIMMLALYSLFALDTLTRMNALKTWLSVVISGVAVVTFIAAGIVDWPAALVMLAGTIAGGVAGARLARRLPAIWLKRVVVALGSVLTLAFFWKVYG
ncbi:sulfite exporter TauE/SafE family protein [Vogesella indigofera]|uniref:sulfite exporter TauE/SafE family protein n=1 Tax=Vogesella indigofera TaxID=45465 RepID=UPI00234EE664|nr:sulfite exporter TauE/SafE family protein [Vogesella indigofera]MDC7701041.1 sulfite exporter TauE/SafE family protein [Vogesella indigofera]